MREEVRQEIFLLEMRAILTTHRALGQLPWYQFAKLMGRSGFALTLMG